MRTIGAPAYVNIFESEFEEKYIIPVIKDKSTLFLQFIDDIFMIWTNSDGVLSNFRNFIKRKHQSIKFDFKFYKDKIEFVDTLVHKDKSNRLQPTLFKKSTDCQNYLQVKICISVFT